MLPFRSMRMVLAAVAVVAVACGDPTLPKATFANSLASYTLYALTGAPPSAPTALLLLGGPTRAERFAFDIAFDLDATGRVRVLPIRVLASPLVPVSKRVGLQVVSGSFDALREVPKTGYDTLSVQSIAPGSVLAIEVIDVNSCISSFTSQAIYGKLVVDSVNVPARRIHARTVVDPNCGYRQVVPDSVPTS
ncbi:MAG: hypothetical protein H0W68_14805 [Gemmatimonadaceae bacterium]|nr:hypothetical protein [Gemmatimonadaceae bacterium]